MTDEEAKQDAVDQMLSLPEEQKDLVLLIAFDIADYSRQLLNQYPDDTDYERFTLNRLLERFYKAIGVEEPK